MSKMSKNTENCKRGSNRGRKITGYIRSIYRVYDDARMARESIEIDPMGSGRKGAKETVGFDEPPEVVVIVTLSIK